MSVINASNGEPPGQCHLQYNHKYHERTTTVKATCATTTTITIITTTTTFYVVNYTYHERITTVKATCATTTTTTFYVVIPPLSLLWHCPRWVDTSFLPEMRFLSQCSFAVFQPPFPALDLA